jgi:hypothetical protein
MAPVVEASSAPAKSTTTPQEALKVTMAPHHKPQALLRQDTEDTEAISSQVMGHSYQQASSQETMTHSQPLTSRATRHRMLSHHIKPTMVPTVSNSSSRRMDTVKVAMGNKGTTADTSTARVVKAVGTRLMREAVTRHEIMHIDC